MNYWLLKSEGSCYSIDDLRRDKRTAWTGIRNFQARNYMRDGMKVGDLAFFYHSSGTPMEPSGIYGVAKVVSKPHIDETTLDPKDEHYDAKAVTYHTEGKEPLWIAVDIEFVEKFTQPKLLSDIKKDKELSSMYVVQPGQRLSVMPVTEREWRRIMK